MYNLAINKCWAKALQKALRKTKYYKNFRNINNFIPVPQLYYDI